MKRLLAGLVAVPLLLVVAVPLMVVVGLLACCDVVLAVLFGPTWDKERAHL